MKYIPRLLQKKLYEYLKNFPVTAITGPRQSGKSTFVKHELEGQYRYVTFDDPLLIDFFYSDPKGFIKQHSDRVILDEVQKVPEIFPYLKMEVDKDRGNYGKYVITGSSQFTLLRHVSESLAGRIGLLSLLPFQYNEIPKDLRGKQILYGSYPELVIRNYEYISEWFASYVSTYIERDVRNLFNIGNLRDFQKLIQLLAARCAQELNMSQLSKELGVTVKTIQSWISVLEASYIIFLLPAYYNNFGKRIIKRPKLYFYDTGLICYLTGVTNNDLLEKGPLSGSIFENYVVSEIKKAGHHLNKNDKLYYFRSSSGLEMDLIIENLSERRVNYLEIKNNSTARYKMIENMKKIMEFDSTGIVSRSGYSAGLTKSPDQKHSKIFKEGYLLYKGSEKGKFTDSIKYINYKDFFDSY